VKRRWYKLLLPLGVVLAIIISTAVVHGLYEPDQSEEPFLSPIQSGPTSAVQLAELVRAKGITINTQLRTSDALTAAWKLRGQVTLFIRRRSTCIRIISGCCATPPRVPG
jgi:hypothetical protein